MVLTERNIGLRNLVSENRDGRESYRGKVYHWGVFNYSDHSTLGNNERFEDYVCRDELGLVNTLDLQSVLCISR